MKVEDTLLLADASGHFLRLAVGAGLSADRVLTVAMGDADRTITFPLAAGTVTSVGVAGNDGISVSGSPVTGSGTITLGLGAITPTQVDCSGAGTFTLTDAATTTVSTAFTVDHESSGTPGDGFGLFHAYKLKSSTTASREAGHVRVEWATAADATRKARLSLWADDTAGREFLRGEASGTAAMIGFLGHAASAQLASPDAGTALVTFGLASGTPTFACANLTGTVADANLAAVGTAGTYAKVTTDAKGRVSSGTTLGTTDLPQRHNLLLNSGAAIWSRQYGAEGTLTSYSDDTYFADRWYALTQTAAIQCNRTTGNLSLYALDLKQNQAAAQRMGCAQIVEAIDSYPFRSRTVRLQFYAKCSTTTTLRYAVLEWTGTADAVTSDVVLSWTSTTYTPNNFFLAASLAVTNGTTTTSVGTSYTLCSMTGAVGSSCNNLIVFVWTDGTAAQNVTVELSDLMLCDDSLARDWLPGPAGAEEAACRRFTLGFNAHPLGLAAANNNLYSYGSIYFCPPMRAAPSLLSSPAAAYTVNAGSAGTVAIQNGWAGGVSFFNSAANWTVNALVKVSAVLDAEL